jgi:hypothetical protein
MKTMKITFLVIGICVSLQTFADTNIALNKTVTITQNSSGWITTVLPSTVCDGITNTFAYEFVGYQNVPYIIIDLGAIYDLSSIITFWGSTYYALQYSVSTSVDKTNWLPNFSVSNNTNNTSTGDPRTLIQTSVRYVKLYQFTSSNPSNYFIDVNEIQIFGTMSPCVNDGAFKKLTVCDNANFNNPATFSRGFSASSATISTLYATKVCDPTATNYYLNPTSTGISLRVKGKIETPEIEVKVMSSNTINTKSINSDNINVKVENVADYVFKSDYKLMSLHDLDLFVKQNSHLPEVPSAEEFNKKGMNISEMNNLLLKKVEELTLYTIELNRRIEELEGENK